MTETLISVLCCPDCLGDLSARLDDDRSCREPGHTLTCEKCKARYRVEKGIPRLYLADDDVIARRDQSKHEEYIIDGKRLKLLAEKLGGTHVERKRRRFFWKRISVLALAGLALAVLAGLSLLTSIAIPVARAPVLVLAEASLLLFILDFALYRVSQNERYQYQLRRLIQLYEASSLSEFDIHLKKTDGQEAEELGDPSEDAPKAAWISERLEKYKGPENLGLNVGCGGELHQLVSQAFFNHGYQLLGVDIFGVYLEQYARIFDVDAVQGNAMALPFKSGQFNIVNFCDILEHLHHPYLGLCEINRVLRPGGIMILSTNYRCRLSRDCANPLILLERIASLFDDRALAPRDLIRRFRDMEFYHLDFSRQELVDLIESSGFEITEFYTYLTKRKFLTTLFSRLPVLRFLGDAILITCKKGSMPHVSARP
jgi:SAM-dependent methyltransferase/uncharacterized protein YbaR (Trm112 family)